MFLERFERSNLLTGLTRIRRRKKRKQGLRGETGMDTYEGVQKLYDFLYRFFSFFNRNIIYFIIILNYYLNYYFKFVKLPIFTYFMLL